MKITKEVLAIIGLTFGLVQSVMFNIDKYDSFCITDLEKDHTHPKFKVKFFTAFYHPEDGLNVTLFQKLQGEANFTVVSNRTLMSAVSNGQIDHEFEKNLTYEMCLESLGPTPKHVFLEFPFQVYTAIGTSNEINDGVSLLKTLATEI